MKLRALLILSLVLIFVSLASPAAVSADTIHCGSTGGNEVWAGSGNVHIVECDVTVAIGSTLTIEEGAIVKFNQAIKITVAGTLRIVGTEADPVYLTSIHDDTVGGDTNGNGASTEPDLRDWAGIHYLDTSSDANSLIEHGVIRYAGYNFKGSVNLAGASPTIRNSTLEEGWYAILADLLSFPKLESNVYRGNDTNGFAYTGGTINADTTWDMTDTSYLLVQSVLVATGHKLTIKPGVVLKIYFREEIVVDGTLRVEGLPADPVYITSILDDTVGGDTNGDGASSAPDVRNWKGIRFRDSSDDENSLLNHAVLRYTGHIFQGSVDLTGASPAIRNTILTDGAYAVKADLRSFPKLQDNAYRDNYINGLVYTGGAIEEDTVWEMTDTSIHTLEHVLVATGNTLTIKPGVVVKPKFGMQLIVDGTLRVLGTASEPVYLTSQRDDAVGGDTDGESSLPGEGDWGGIVFRAGSDDANSLVDHAVIRYGGSSNKGNINLFDAAPSISNSTITLGYAGLLANGSQPRLTCNTIQDNRYRGVLNETPETAVNARSQWWGGVTGPYHRQLNPDGK